MNIIYRLAAILTIWAWCAGCSPADWAKVAAVGQVAGAALDGAAVARADQIRARSIEAEAAARDGDTEAAMAALNAALVSLASETYRDLQEARAQCPRLPAPVVSVPAPSAAKAPVIAPDPTASPSGSAPAVAP